MTLENKAGLAVACTFATLVGVVGWLMQHPEASWGSPGLAGTSEREDDKAPPSDPKPPAEKGTDKGTNGKKTQPPAKSDHKPPFDDQSLLPGSGQAIPTAAPARSEGNKPSGDTHKVTEHSTAPPSSWPFDSGSTAGQDSSEGKGGSSHSSSRTRGAGQGSDIQLTGAENSPLPPGNKATSGAADKKDTKKGTSKAELDEQGMGDFPSFAPPQGNTPAPSVGNTGTARDRKTAAAGTSGRTDPPRGSDPPSIAAPGAPPAASGKTNTGSQAAAPPYPSMATTGFPLEVDPPSSRDNKPAAATKTGAGASKSTSVPGPTGSQSSLPPPDGTVPNRSATQPRTKEPPVPPDIGFPGSSLAPSSGAPLSGAPPSQAANGGKPQPVGGSGLPSSGSSVPGKTGNTTPAPVSSFPMDGGHGTGSAEASSAGSTPPPPPPLGIDSNPPPAAGTGTIGIGGPGPAASIGTISAGGPAPSKPLAPGGNPGMASGAAPPSSSIFIPDPQEAAPAARSPAAPSPVPSITIPAPTTQPGATGGAPTMIAGSGSARSPAPPVVRPQVSSSTERYWLVQPGDTPSSLSERFYKSQAYGPALLKYLQNDQRNSPALTANGQLKPDVPIFVPDDPRELTQHAGEAMIPSAAPVASTSAPTLAPPPPPAPPAGPFNGR